MKKLILIIFLLFASCTPYSYKDDNKNSIDILANEPLLIPSYENPDKMVNLDTFLTNYKLKYPKIKKDTIGRDSVMEKT